MTYIRIFEHKKNSRHEYSNMPIGFTVYGIHDCVFKMKNVLCKKKRKKKDVMSGRAIQV